MIRMLSLCLLLAALAACDDSPSSPTPSPRPDVVNTLCPVCPPETGELGDGMAVVEYEGKRIGFCCPMCVEKWDVMSDEEKRARLPQ